ncbi:MAG: PTS sugar transporter subunit IIA [Pseudomonadota bacterium]
MADDDPVSEQSPFDPARLLCADCVRTDVQVTDMVDLMRTMAEPLSRATGIGASAIAEGLVQRERVQSTAFGGGVAVPHARLPEAGRITGALAILRTPLDMDALDGAPVDLVYALVSPETVGADHLKALAAVSRLFRDRQLVTKLRGAQSGDAVNALLVSGGWSLAG